MARGPELCPHTPRPLPSPPWQDFVRTDSLFVRFLFPWNACTLLGIVPCRVRLRLSRSPYFLPVAAFPVIFPITFYIAHTTLRHRHPSDPAIALILALAIVGTGVRHGPK